MESRTIVEKEYQRILKNIKHLSENESILGGQNGFAAVLKKDFLTDSEKSLKELEDVVSGLGKKMDFWQGWQDAVKINRIEDTLNPDWLRKGNPWLMGKSAVIDAEGLGLVSKLMPSHSLLELEKKTFQMADRLSMDLEMPIASAQFSLIDSISDMAGDKWKKMIAPPSFLTDYEKLVENQHKAIQKVLRRDEFDIEGRLGMLDAASKFVDRQVGWTSGFLNTVQEQAQEEREAYDEVIPDIDAGGTKDEAEIPSTLSKIPQYIGYTNRKDLHITPEEGLEKSILVEITEMGKQIVENAMAINNLCESKDRDIFFKLTGKLVTGAVGIATITCTSRDELGKVIDALYFLFYENLERIKKVVTDQAVRGESVYACIFAVKSIRTDFRHDFEHGKEASIKKKRKEINDYYKKYCGRIPLKQKDFLILQKNLFGDILRLEEHLTEKLEELQAALS